MALLNTANALRIGSSSASAAYAGTTPVWPPPFSPASLPGLMLWLDASQLSLADLAPVSSWPDRSGAGRDAAQATGTLQPLCIRTGLAGLRIVRFDGVDDYLLTPSWAWPAQQSLVMLAKARDTVPNKDGFANIGTNPNRIFQFRQQDASVIWGIGYDTTQLGTTFTAPAPTQTWHRLAYVRGATTMEIFTDGTSPGPVTVAAGAALNVTTYIGTANFQVLPGAVDVAEVIAYDHALTTGERAQLDAYLQAKWGV